MPRTSTLLYRIFASFVALSLLLGALPPSHSAIAAPAKYLQEPLNSNKVLFGSGWQNTKIPQRQPVPLLSEQLATQVHEDEFAENPVIHLDADPAIYLPGNPIDLNWQVNGLGQETRKVSLIFSLPIGISPIDRLLARRVSADHKLIIPINGDSTETIAFHVSTNTQVPFYIGAELLIDGVAETVSSDAVYFNTSTNEAQKGKSNQINGHGNKVKMDIEGDAIDEDLAIDIRPPSPNKQPGYSLSTDPIEIIAVGKSSKKNVKKFKHPVTVQISYDESQLPKRWQEADLQIFYYNEEVYEWYPMETVVDTANNTLTTQTDHLTVFDYKAASWQGYTPPSIDSAYQVAEYTGAGTYNMQFWTPPGSAGFQPVVSLDYNSQVIDEGTGFTQAAWVGMGWNLDTGAIIRDMHGTNDNTDDDTFRISVGSISGTLLPINSTTYNTADQSFVKVVKNSSSWTAYGKDGTVYQFELESKTSKTSGCTTASNLNITWRWSLTSATDKNGNQIVYTYYEEPKNGTTCANEIAVYPDTITYANAKYRIRFVRESRNDYQSGWTDNSSLVLFGRYRLNEIQIEYLPPNSGTWTLVRKYDFTYSSSITNQIMPRFKWRNITNNFTTTLVGVQEIDASGFALPATQFFYEDDLHLTKVDNGQGGQIQLSYTQKNFYDDVNDAERSVTVSVGQGGWECTDGVTISPWVGIINLAKVRCDPSTSPYSLQVGEDPDFSAAHRTLPEYLVKNGARYNVLIKAGPIVGSSSLEVSLIDPTKSGDNENSVIITTISSTTEAQGQGNMSSDFDPNKSRLRVECSDCRVRNFTVQMMIPYYMVSSETVTDLVSNQSTTLHWA